MYNWSECDENLCGGLMIINYQVGNFLSSFESSLYFFFVGFVYSSIIMHFAVSFITEELLLYHLKVHLLVIDTNGSPSGEALSKISGTRSRASVQECLVSVWCACYALPYGLWWVVFWEGLGPKTSIGKSK